MTTSTGSSRYADPRASLLVLGLVALTWAACLNAGFFWDDRALVLSEPRSLSRILYGDLWEGTSPYYRPVTGLSLRLDQALFGSSAAGYHLVNLLWHLAATALVGRLAQLRLSPERALAVMALFGLHPIQGEAITWIVARNDPMAAVGVLAALLLADRARKHHDAGRHLEGRVALLGVALAGLLGSFAKETAILTPIFLLLWRWTAGERARVTEIGAAALGPAAAGVVRLLLEVQDPMTGSNQFITSYVPEALVHLLAWLSIPWPLTSVGSALGPPDRIEWVAAAITVGLALWLRQAWRWWFLAAAAVAPALFSGLSTGLLGERFLYLPLAFLSIGLVGAVPTLTPTWQLRLRAPALGVVLGALLINQLRLREWHDETTLLHAALLRAPSSYVYFSLGNLAAREHDNRNAYRWWLAAVRDTRPMLNACGRPELELLKINAVSEALTVGTESKAGACGAVPSFQQRWFTVQILAAAAGLPVSAYPTRAPADVDPRALAVWGLGQGDLLAPMAVAADPGALGWRGRPARFREHVWDFSRGTWPSD